MRPMTIEQRLRTSRLQNPRPKAARRLAALALTAVLLPAAGCGKKGDPTPPLRAIPAPVKDLALHQQGEDFVLQFEYPKTTIGGGPLPGIARIELMELAEAAPPEGQAPQIDGRRFAAAADVRQNLNEPDLAAASSGDRVYLRLPIPQLGEGEGGTGETRRAYSFALRVLASNGEISGLSNVVSMVPQPSPEPPTDLNLIPSPDGLKVTWKAPEGETVESFNIYRRDARSRSYRRALRSVGAGETSYLDGSARFEQRYIYTVTTVVSQEPLVESRLSGEAEVLYQDRFSPEPPARLVALAETDQVRLRWDASESSDVTAYHVYRRRSGEDFRRITRIPIQQRELVDQDVQREAAYTYRLTALDSLGNEGDPGEEVDVTVR